MSLPDIHWLRPSIISLFRPFEASQSAAIIPLRGVWKLRPQLLKAPLAKQKATAGPAAAAAAAAAPQRITQPPPPSRRHPFPSSPRPLPAHAQYIYSASSLRAPLGRCPHRDREKPLYLIAMLEILITLLPWKHNTVKEQLLREHRAAGGAISGPS